MLQVSAGIVILNSKILCFQKGPSKFDYLSYKFEFPGGKIESKETAEEALIREFNEELNVDISNFNIKRLTELSYNYPDFSVTLYPFIVECEQFEFTLIEHVASKWLEPSDLWSVDWAEADKGIVKELEAIYD